MPTEAKTNAFDALDAKDTAALLCLPKRQLQNLVEQGLPKHGEGKGSYYAWSEVFQWYIAYKIDQGGAKASPNRLGGDVQINGESFDHALCRKTIADVDLKGLALGKGCGSGSGCRRGGEHRRSSDSGKSQIVGLAKQAGPNPAILKTKPEIRKALDSEMRQTCDELTNVKADNVSINS